MASQALAGYLCWKRDLCILSGRRWKWCEELGRVGDGSSMRFLQNWGYPLVFLCFPGCCMPTWLSRAPRA